MATGIISRMVRVVSGAEYQPEEFVAWGNEIRVHEGDIYAQLPLHPKWLRWLRGDVMSPPRFPIVIKKRHKEMKTYKVTHNQEEFIIPSYVMHHIIDFSPLSIDQTEYQVEDTWCVIFEELLDSSGAIKEWEVSE
jgi:hypothetical protein